MKRHFSCNILFFCLSLFPDYSMLFLCNKLYWMFLFLRAKLKYRSRSHSYWLRQCSTCINTWWISGYLEKKGLLGGQSITVISPKLLIDVAAQVSEESPVMVSVLSIWKSTQEFSVGAMGPPTHLLEISRQRRLLWGLTHPFLSGAGEQQFCHSLPADNLALATERAKTLKGGPAPPPIRILLPASECALLLQNSAFLTEETVEQNTDNNKMLMFSKKNPS